MAEMGIGISDHRVKFCYDTQRVTMMISRKYVGSISCTKLPYGDR